MTVPKDMRIHFPFVRAAWLTFEEIEIDIYRQEELEIKTILPVLKRDKFI